MKRYAVVFEESAQVDVRESYDWGCRAWGKREAQNWLRQLRKAVSQQLAVVPKAFPQAPEDEEFSEEIRQMVVGRYRVLFTIKGRKVHVLHVRGAYVGASDQLEDDR
ncbi:MAG TPA: type II toxin-antitoxin system RelE/ParE family toxin [Pyrinomonadaceae bacterium]|nr:type II toxin-antitoxin system RelE/ParE family toxin [Pyrinomonadaceae bacterium]